MHAKARWMVACLISAGVVLAAGVLPASAHPGAAQSDQDSADQGISTILTVPGTDGTPDVGIPKRLVELIHDTPAGASIDASTYQWGHTPTPDKAIVAEALASAQARGVHIRAAIDGSMEDNQSTGEKILRKANLDRLVYCHGPHASTACISTRANAINHDKLFMFSRTGSMHDVVVVGSQNITSHQNDLFQNAVVFHGYTGLYTALERHMDNMLNQRKDDDYYNSKDGSYSTADGTVGYFMSPRADSDGGTSGEAATNTDAAILNRMRSYEPGCRVSVAMGHFGGGAIPAVEELIRIADLGCQVRIVYMYMGTGEELNNLLQDNPRIQVRGLYDGRHAKQSVHSKYVAMRGTIDGDPDSRFVRSGSPNWTLGSLRVNDEIGITVKNRGVEDAFENNFDIMWRRARHCPDPPPDDLRICREKRVWDQ